MGPRGGQGSHISWNLSAQGLFPTQELLRKRCVCQVLFDSNVCSGLNEPSTCYKCTLLCGTVLKVGVGGVRS